MSSNYSLPLWQSTNNSHYGFLFRFQQELKAAIINKELLDYRRYNVFIKEREDAILKKLSKRTGISESDFEFLYEE